MDREQYRKLVMQHKDRLHTYAVWLLQDREEARDVAQEALMRAWRHREAIHNGAGKAWLLKTTYRLCLDQLRRRSNRPQVNLADLSVLPADHGLGPERGAMMSDLRGIIRRALATLGPRDKAVILIREMHDMSYEEMAEVLDVPLGTLKVVLHRARERLRRELIGAGVCP